MIARARRLAAALRDAATDYAEDLRVVQKRIGSRTMGGAAIDSSAWAIGLLRLSIGLRRGVGSSLGTRGALRVLFHIDVWSDDIGGGLSLPHPFNVVIGGGAHVGRGCTLLHNVTIQHGERTTIGDGAFLGVGSVVLANRHIGDFATLGANAVATQDVPTGAIAAGVPARVLRVASAGTKEVPRA